MPDNMRPDKSGNVGETLRRINEAWLSGQPEKMRPLLDEKIVMVYPGFAGRSEGQEAFIAGYTDFCGQALMISFQESDLQIDVRGATVVASYAFEMTYERKGDKYLSKGRDLWVFTQKQDEWVAVWRTMLDLTEETIH
jgi:ketosteroid isomerase-like protein